MPMMQYISKVVTATCSCISATGLPAAISEEVAAVLCLETNWSNLKIATEDLEAIEARVRGEVAVAINQLKECDPPVALWKKRVEKQLKEEITEEEYNKLDRCHSLCNCTPNLFHRYRLGKRIAEKLKDLNELVNEGKEFRDFGWKPLEDPVEQRPKARTFGMESVMAQLHGYFDNKEKSIIGIWGQGGVGKTTLLNMFNNELKERSGEFNVVIWIDVSNYQRLNVVNIQRMITDRLGLEWNGQDEGNTRARVLAKNLRKKNFVILLDDVWEAFRLEEVGIPEPGADKKCKIILASRDKHVCVEMGAQKSLIEMPLLDDQAAWELFRNNLTADDLTAIDDSPDGENVIGGYAVDIARNCGRLPLALKVIGSAVAGLKDPKEWCDAVEATKAGLEDIDGVDKMFLRLKYSYDRLNLELKECFLYCTLFPGNSWIKKDQLVDYWVAEGVIPNDRKSRSNIRLLASACLLQYNDSQSEVKLHHIIRQWGLWLTTEQGKFLVKSGMDLKDAPDEAESWREAKRISLMSIDIRDIKIIPECKYLQTLFLQNNPNLAKLSPEFFRSMSSLRVLDLSYTAITELPECDALVELAHLNLNHTSIVTLPNNFYILKQLMHLDLSVTSALDNTSDNCSKLLELRVLNLFRSKYGIRDVNDLNIDSLKKLEFLGIAIHAQDVLAKLKKKHPLAKSTHRLSLKHCRGMKSIQTSELKKMEHLEELYIESCNDLKELIADADEQRASCLQVLTLAVLPNLDTVSVGKVSHYFQILRDLSIDNCHKLDNVTWVLQLKSLERLEISHCDGMIQVVREMQNEIQEVEDGANEVMHCREFPKLKSIVLNSLNLLESICGVREFSCLESIRVEGCPKLKKLPVSGNYKMLKLKQICGSDEWWKRLIWEEETMRKKADEYFIQISEVELENRY